MSSEAAAMQLARLSETSANALVRGPHCAYPSDDDDVALLTDDFVDIFTLRPTAHADGVSGDAPTFRFDSLLVPEDYPTRRAQQNEMKELALDPLDLAHLNLDPVLSIENRWSLDRHRPRVISVSWSPREAVRTVDRLLAVLTDVGGVTVWDRTRRWVQIHNVSDLIAKSIITEHVTGSDYLNLLRANCDKLQTTAITWAETLHHKDSVRWSFLIAAQKNGDIHFVEASCRDLDRRAVRLNEVLCIQTEIRFTTVLHWSQLNENEGILFSGNSMGLLFASKINVSSGVLLKSIPIWAEADRMRIDKILPIPHVDGHLCVVFFKRSFVIAAEIDFQCEHFQTTLMDLGNLTVSGIVPLENGLLVTTQLGAIYEVQIYINEGVIKLECRRIKTDVDFSDFLLNGVWGSRNRVLFALCLSPKVVVNKEYGRIKSKLVFCKETSSDPFQILFNNPSNSLADCYDCLELIRSECTSHNTTIDSLYTEMISEMSLYELKVRMWLSVMAMKFEKMITAPNEHYKMVILCESIKNSLKVMVSEVDPESASRFQLKTVTAYINFFTNYQAVSDKQYPKEVISSAVAKFGDRLQPDFNPKCEWCGENIQLIYCPNNHPRQWCSVTLNDIETNECLQCPFCGHLAHLNLMPKIPRCPFCDTHFQLIPSIKS